MHAHSHDHQHAHQNTASDRIAMAFFLNFGFTIIEFVGAYYTNSTAILADAVHDMGDSLSIGLAWILAKLSTKAATPTYSYGFRRFSALGALINGVVLTVGSLWVISEAVPRLSDPQMPVVEGMFWLAILGVSVNGYAAYKLSKGSSLNEQMLNWHLLEDVLGWVAVLVVSIVLMFVDWPILDPILSIIFTLFIMLNVLRYLWSTMKLLLQAVPDKAMTDDIRASLLDLPPVSDIHHLHFWSLDGEYHVMTAHLVLGSMIEPEAQIALKAEIATLLSHYDLAHTTIELEFPSEACRDEDGF